MDQAEILKIANSKSGINNKLLEQIRNLKTMYSIPFVVETDGEGIVVYPNILFGYDGYTDTNGGLMLADGRHRIKITDEKKAYRQEKTKLGRFLKKIIGDSVKDNYIRDLTEKLRMALDPEGLKKFVIFPDTIESYYKMFDMNNGSCLQVGTQHYGATVAAKWELFRKHHNMHPGAWLMYNPRLQGVYMVDGKGNTVARAVLYMHEGEAIAFDYSKGLGMNGFVLEMLMHNNVIKSNTKNVPLWVNDKPFVIPGVKLPDDQEVYFPWPTLDPPVQCDDGLYVAYDKDTETLRVADGPNHPFLKGFKAHPAGYRYSHKGFAKASNYK